MNTSPSHNISIYDSIRHNSTNNNVPAVSVVDTNPKKLSVSTAPLHSIIKNKQYIVIPNCLLEHLITNDDSTGTSTLSPLEKLYFLLACSLSIINYNNNNGYATDITAKSWAAILGCSKSQIFHMQSRLEKLGYFIILRDRNEHGQNNRNVITPTLPDNIFKLLCKSPENQYNADPQLAYSSNEPKLAYLSRVKQYIPISYRLLKTLTSDKSLPPSTKLIYLDCIVSNHKYLLHSKSNDNYNEDNELDEGDSEEQYFFTNYSDLAKRYGKNIKYISAAYSLLSDRGMITREAIKSRFIKSLGIRQDHNLWKISICLPEEYAIEILKTKNRNSCSVEANYQNQDTTTKHQIQQSNIIVDAVIDKLKEIKSVDKNILNLTNTDKLENIEPSNNDITDPVNCSNNISQNDSNICHDNNSVLSKSQHPSTPHVDTSTNNAFRCVDPQFRQFGQYYNKDILLKKYISNLRGNSKVIFYDFLINLGLDGFVPKKYIEQDRNKKEVGKKKIGGVGSESGSNASIEVFSITRELIRAKLKQLPKDKANKARKFAYSIHSKGLATGYAASLSKHELAKQLIFHAATWKPTKLGKVSREKEIDTALSMAWKAMVNGIWQSPLEWAKADIIQHEYSYYKKKYQESGVISPEVKTLEVEVDKILGGYSNLTGRITGNTQHEREQGADNQQSLTPIISKAAFVVENIVDKANSTEPDQVGTNANVLNISKYKKSEGIHATLQEHNPEPIDAKSQIGKIKTMLQNKTLHSHNSCKLDLNLEPEKSNNLNSLGDIAFNLVNQICDKMDYSNENN